MKITLNELEQQLANNMAMGSVKTSDDRGYQKRKRDDTKSDYEISLDGFGAELAVAKALNVYPSLSNEYSKIDLNFNGTVNVKSTHYPNGRLLVPDYQGRTTDWYILVIGKIPEYRIAGVAHADQVFRKENIKDLGKGPAYLLTQNQLQPFADWASFNSKQKC